MPLPALFSCAIFCSALLIPSASPTLVPSEPLLRPSPQLEQSISTIETSGTPFVMSGNIDGEESGANSSMAQNSRALGSGVSDVAISSVSSAQSSTQPPANFQRPSAEVIPEVEFSDAEAADWGGKIDAPPRKKPPSFGNS